MSSDAAEAESLADKKPELKALDLDLDELIAASDCIVKTPQNPHSNTGTPATSPTASAAATRKDKDKDGDTEMQDAAKDAAAAPSMPPTTAAAAPAAAAEVVPEVKNEIKDAKDAKDVPKGEQVEQAKDEVCVAVRMAGSEKAAVEVLSTLAYVVVVVVYGFDSQIHGIGTRTRRLALWFSTLTCDSCAKFVGKLESNRLLYGD